MHTASTTEIEYVGDELELFAHADRWKRYIRDRLGPYIRGSVAEVGAGIGTTTTSLIDNANVTDWTCIEPDPEQAASLAPLARSRGGPVDGIVTGTLDDLDPARRFDTILYIDVLEHIEGDAHEVAKARAMLKPGGNLIILVPAWNFLYSPFDKAIGHFRRYRKATLRAVRDGELRETAAFYMDSVGFFASVANKVALRQGMPTAGQVAMWDTYLVPLSRMVDPLLGRFFGKSLVIVWTRPAN